jgi:hypothetical protein
MLYSCQQHSNRQTEARLKATLLMQEKVDKVVRRLQEDCDSSIQQAARLEVEKRQQKKVKRK